MGQSITESDTKRFRINDVRLIHAELLTGQTGVRITDISIPEMTDEQVAEVKGLVSEYCVAVLPSQPLTPEQHIEFVGRLDPIMFTPGEALINCTRPLGLLKRAVARRDACLSAYPTVRSGWTPEDRWT